MTRKIVLHPCNKGKSSPSYYAIANHHRNTCILFNRLLLQIYMYIHSHTRNKTHIHQNPHTHTHTKTLKMHAHTTKTHTHTHLKNAHTLKHDHIRAQAHPRMKDFPRNR